MVNIQYFQRHYFWSGSTTDTTMTYPYHFNSILPMARFKEILKALNITNKIPPSYKYTFWVRRQLTDAWNHNMDTIHPYIYCLDKSMMKRFNK